MFTKLRKSKDLPGAEGGSSATSVNRVLHWQLQLKVPKRPRSMNSVFPQSAAHDRSGTSKKAATQDCQVVGTARIKSWPQLKVKDRPRSKWLQALTAPALLGLPQPKWLWKMNRSLMWKCMHLRQLTGLSYTFTLPKEELFKTLIRFLGWIEAI